MMCRMAPKNVEGVSGERNGEYPGKRGLLAGTPVLVKGVEKMLFPFSKRPGPKSKGREDRPLPFCFYACRFSSSNRLLFDSPPGGEGQSHQAGAEEEHGGGFGDDTNKLALVISRACLIC